VVVVIAIVVLQLNPSSRRLSRVSSYYRHSPAHNHPFVTHCYPLVSVSSGLLTTLIVLALGIVTSRGGVLAVQNNGLWYCFCALHRHGSVTGWSRRLLRRSHVSPCSTTSDLHCNESKISLIPFGRRQLLLIQEEVPEQEKEKSPESSSFQSPIGTWTGSRWPSCFKHSCSGRDMHQRVWHCLNLTSTRHRQATLSRYGTIDHAAIAAQNVS
jgi:hypothetical protein